MYHNFGNTSQDFHRIQAKFRGKLVIWLSGNLPQIPKIISEYFLELGSKGYKVDFFRKNV